MILSICMMVKNEENNLDRCLNSLTHIRESLKCEIIIVDTGSSDNTVEIAKKYTDKVYYHDWNNNFSEIRNLTMSFAKGKWILILDADEELIDDTELIKFLTTKQNKDITGAAIFLRNIKNLQKNSYSSELVTIRIIKNGLNAYYEGTVHNRLVINGKIMQLSSILNHYGYILDDQELMEKKFLRTKNMLIGELNKTPDSPYLLYQLATSFGMHNDSAEAYYYSKKAFDLVIDKNLDLKKFPYVISSYCKDSYATGKFREAIIAAEIGIKAEPDFVDLYFYKASSHGKLNELIESIDEYKNYLNCLNRFDNSNFKYNPSIQHYTLHSQNEAYCNLTLLSIELLNNKEAIEYAQLLLKTDNEESMYVKSIMNKYIEVLIKEKSTILINDLFLRYKFKTLQLIELIESKLAEYSINDRNEFYESLSRLDNYYGTINKYRTTIIFEVDSLTEKEINELKQGVIEGIPDAFYLCLKYNIALEELLLNIDETNIMNQIAISNERYNDFQIQIIKRLKIVSSDENYQSLNACRIYKKYLAIKNISSNENLYYFDDYIEILIKFLEFKFNGDYLSLGLYDLFNKQEEQFGVILYNLMKTYNKNLITKAIALYPEMREVLIRWINKKLDNVSLPSEMMTLKESLIKHIISLSDDKNYFEAIKLVEEGLKLIPNDLELISIKSNLVLLEKGIN